MSNFDNSSSTQLFSSDMLSAYSRDNSIDTVAMSTPYAGLNTAEADVARILASYDLKAVYNQLGMGNEASGNTHGFASPKVASTTAMLGPPLQNLNPFQNNALGLPPLNSNYSPTVYEYPQMAQVNTNDGNSLPVQHTSAPSLDPTYTEVSSITSVGPTRQGPAAVCYCGDLSLDNLVCCSQASCRYGVMHAHCAGFYTQVTNPSICLDCLLRLLPGAATNTSINQPTLAQPSADDLPTETHNLAAFGALNTLDMTNIPTPHSQSIPGLMSSGNSLSDSSGFLPPPIFAPAHSITPDYGFEDFSLYGSNNIGLRAPVVTLADYEFQDLIKIPDQEAVVVSVATIGQNITNGDDSLVVDSSSESADVNAMIASDSESDDTDEDEDAAQRLGTDGGSPVHRRINHRLAASRQRVTNVTAWPSFTGPGDKYDSDIVPQDAPRDEDYTTLRPVIQPDQTEITRTKKGNKTVKRTSTRALAWRGKLRTDCPGCHQRIKKRVLVRIVPRSAHSHAQVAKHGRYVCSNCKKRHYRIKTIAAHVRAHNDPTAVVLDEGTETFEILIDQARVGDEYAADVDTDMDGEGQEEDDAEANADVDADTDAEDLDEEYE